MPIALNAAIARRRSRTSGMREHRKAYFAWIATKLLWRGGARRPLENAAQRQKLTSNNAQLDKSLPAIPPPEARKTLYSPTSETHSETSEPMMQLPSVRMPPPEEQRQYLAEHRDPSPAVPNYTKGNSKSHPGLWRSCADINGIRWFDFALNHLQE